MYSCNFTTLDLSDYKTIVNSRRIWIARVSENNEVLLFTDYDECLFNINDCRQLCFNNDGGYDCGCFDGYRLNGKTCDGL